MRTRPNPTGDECARCGKTFAGFADRRAQVRGGDLCQACHLDPRARALPIETDHEGGWLRRTGKTLIQLLSSPSASFRAVEEPVSHGRVLLFLATLRLPLWLLTIAWLAVDTWLSRGEIGPMKRPSILGELVIGAQFADVLRLWLLMMIPLGLPLLYFVGGILAHSAMAMTGGARRSIGASMRAFGLALAPSLLIVGALDFAVIVLDVEPELWAGVVAFVGLLGFSLIAIALARTHATSLIRGLLVALVPAAFFVAVLTGRGLLETPRFPLMPAPEPDSSYIPYPIE
ncbi:hypothetical protein ACNOYE_35100 [Nannocystaceae bacterium ST9]